MPIGATTLPIEPVWRMDATSPRSGILLGDQLWYWSTCNTVHADDARELWDCLPSVVDLHQWLRSRR